MSTSYDIYCEDCLESLWVGQQGGGGDTFYTGHPEVMEALGRFLWKHENHELKFASCHWADVYDKEYNRDFQDGESP
ncbi:MAG: hypothetical protein V3S20_06490 [Dehalococcoidia bacterium]